LAVYAMNPKQAERFRDRHSAAGSKDDSKDAYVSADALRTDLHKFQKLSVLAPEFFAVREVSRRLERLKDDLRQASNRLWHELNSFAPGLLSCCHAADEPFFWDLLELAADHTKALKLRPAKVDAILRRYRKTAVSSNDVLKAFREERFSLLPGHTEAVLTTIAAYLPQLRVIHQLLTQAEKDLTAVVQAVGRDAVILDSFKGIHDVVAGVILAEAPQAILDRDLSALRAYAGAAPVSRQSGNSRRVVMRRACNPRLRNACWHWARTAAVHDPWAKERYIAMRARGLGYDRALRGLVDRLLSRLIACLRDDVLYDPSRGKKPSTECDSRKD
jgi:transposase